MVLFSHSLDDFLNRLLVAIVGQSAHDCGHRVVKTKAIATCNELFISATHAIFATHHGIDQSTQLRNVSSKLEELEILLCFLHVA